MTLPKIALRPRKRGAQPGNNNAYKHGHRCRLPKPAVDTNAYAQNMLELQAEEDILDELIRRTLHLMDENSMSPREWNASLRVLAQAIGRKESIHRTRRLPTHHDNILDQALEQLKIVLLEQD